MAGLVDELQKGYPHMTDATALFSHSGDNHALRVEASTIGLEFTDNSYLGSDSKGFLLYRDRNDLSSSTDGGSEYKVLTVVFHGIRYALVKFYRASEDDSYAQFVAEDHVNAVGAAQMGGFSGTGQWRALRIGSASATISKNPDDSAMIMNVRTIGKKAIWKATDDEDLKKASVDVTGMLYFREIDTVTEGLHVNYNDERIVFYYNSYSAADFRAYFIPFKGQPGTLGHPGDGLELGGATWTDSWRDLREKGGS